MYVHARLWHVHMNCTCFGDYAAALMAHNIWSVSYFKKKLGYKKEHITVIGNFLENDFFLIELKPDSHLNSDTLPRVIEYTPVYCSLCIFSIRVSKMIFSHLRPNLLQKRFMRPINRFRDQIQLSMVGNVTLASFTICFSIFICTSTETLYGHELSDEPISDTDL